MASKLPPSRAMSLDSAVLAAEDDDQFEVHIPPLADHSDSFRKHAHIPAHALCMAKTRSYTSPHLTSQTAVGGSASKENVSGARNVSALANGGSTAINIEPAPVIPVDVFLAGSCNPTTWRRDVAIPLLDTASIKYFNPQVDEWYEELVHEETRAKEGAKIILMVIDSATRSIVCINESVEYICRGRRLILVVQNIKVGTAVDCARITDSELADLNGARECLRRLAMRRGVRLYDDISMAVEETIECLVEENPKRFAPEKPRLRKRSSIILNEWAGQYRSRRSTSRSWSSTNLLSLISGISDDAEDTEGEEAGSASTDLSFVHHGGTSASRSRKGSVYLGGTLQSTSWREKVAIPRLQKAGLPFYIPYQDFLAVELQRLSSKQMQPLSDRWGEMEAAREDAELILFVIPSRTRSIAAMTEAVELICNAHAMILVLEPLDEGCLLDDGHQLVGREFKDVARARVYLQEMAERHHVEVFQSVKDAVTGIIERLQR